jgi:putative endonuclease
MNWFIYIIECADTTLYTGITTNITRRLHEHNYSKVRSSKYTRSKRPVRLVFEECANSRSAASKREAEIKRLSRIEKRTLIMKAGIVRN